MSCVLLFNQSYFYKLYDIHEVNQNGFFRENGPDKEVSELIKIMKCQWHVVELWFVVKRLETFNLWSGIKIEWQKFPKQSIPLLLVEI